MNDLKIKKMISKMIMIGFKGEQLPQWFAEQINKYNPGGIILFGSNISSPLQLKELIKHLYSCCSDPVFIAIDQEGGKVSRLKPENGFSLLPSASWIGERDDPDLAKEIYQFASEELFALGINCNLAPVVDLAINPENWIIVKLGRSYGASAEKVIKYARIFCDALYSKGIISVLKHFPGHGSSLEDSHKGFVDISESWDPVELKPYEVLIREKRAKMIMTAHVFNRNFDPDYPATLSHDIINRLLRDKLGFRGVVISDDMQMKAIADHYSLSEAVRLAINAGVNMLIFANQMGTISLEEIVELVYNELKHKNISLERIIESNKLIQKLLEYALRRPDISSSK